MTDQGPGSVSTSSILSRVLDVSMLTEYNKRFISLWAGLLTGLSIILYSVSFIFLNLASAAPLISTVAYAFYLLLGLLALFIGFKRTVPSTIFIYVSLILVSLYFVLLGVSIIFSGYIISPTVLIISGILILTPLFRRKQRETVDRVITYFFVMVGLILAYIGVITISIVITGNMWMSANIPYIVLTSSFFASYTSMASAILYILTLMVREYINKYPIGRDIIEFLTYLVFLIYGAGEIYLGGSVISLIGSVISFYALARYSMFTFLFIAGLINALAGVLVMLSALIAIYLQYKRLQPILRQVKAALGPYIQPQQV